MDRNLLIQLGFSATFIDKIDRYPEFPLYEIPYSEDSSLQVMQQITEDLIINNPGKDFNDPQLQHFNSKSNFV